MHRSLLVLALALAAATACSDSPTYPVLNIGDSGAKPTAQILQGVLVLTEDEIPRYALQTGSDGRVVLKPDLGRLLAASSMDGAVGFDPADYPLHPVPIAEWQGFLFLSLAESPEPFETSHAPLPSTSFSCPMPRCRV